MKQTLRTHQTQTEYEKSMVNERAQGWRRCYLCAAKTIKEFGDWKIVENEYPYDKIAETHHMLTLKRHLDRPLTQQVKYELENTIRPYLHQHYDMIFENTVKTKSIPGHHHLHMITLKDILPVQPSNTTRTIIFTKELVSIV